MGVVINPGSKPWYTSAMGITISGTTKTYKTYADMLKDPSPGKLAWVEDATADPTVETGSALYSWKEHAGWTKIYETESMDQQVQNVGITNFIGYVANELQLESIYTEDKLIEMFPDNQNGIFAIVGTTDTIWVWDVDEKVWKDTNATPATYDWTAITNKPEVFPATFESVTNSDNETLQEVVTTIKNQIIANDEKLAAVAVSGSYNDLKDIPETFTPSQHQHQWSDIASGVPNFSIAGHTHDDRYAPIVHVHDDRYSLTNHDHAGVYANVVHQHDDAYAPIVHTHNDLYATIGHNHTGIYSTVAHNHDTIYAGINHNHDTVYAIISHNHDDAYADINHNHNTVYSVIEHNHDGVYAVVNHNHDEAYSDIDHNHDTAYTSPNAVAEMIATSLARNDYTAFEVYAHIADIEVGESVELGGYVTKSIPAQMTHRFGIRAQQTQDKQNVVVDWGDGEQTSLADIVPVSNYYWIQHTYATPGRYVVKIFGNTYFAIAQSNAFDYRSPNILCRVLDMDLPIASHLGNLSSFCINSNHLIHVNIPASFNWANVKNLSSIFWDCKNLLTVSGLPLVNKFNFQYSAAHRGCDALQSTDLSMVPLCYGGWAHMFNGCKDMNVDIGDILYYPFSSKDQQCSVAYVFNNCAKLHGTVPGHKLWDDTDMIWSNTANAFTGCSPEIRAQVPISWGGTNAIIEARLQLRNMGIDLNNYTAFEVYAHSADIPVGESAELGGTVNVALPAAMTHAFTIRSSQDANDQNVIIDWGDGTLEQLSTMTPTFDPDDKEYTYSVSHTYAVTGKYIIKMYGYTYFGLIQSNGTNIICRILESDLPVAAHLKNFSSFARYASHLLHVDMTNCNNFLKNYVNIANLFNSCSNLLTVTGFSSREKINLSCGYLFHNCKVLQFTDFILPKTYGGLVTAFNVCLKLEADIGKILSFFYPEPGTTADLKQTFRYASKLFGTVPAHKLWERKDVNWINTVETFKGCSAEIRAQVPVSWGGTNTSIDAKTYIQDYTYFTSFEVCPNTVEIPVGDNDLIGTVSEAIPAATFHRMVIRTMDGNIYTKGISDVVVEWGDGTYSAVATGDHERSVVKDDTAVADDGEINYTFEHDYAAVLSEAEPIKKFTIKVYGKQYYAISHLVKPANTGVYQRDNLMCNVFCGTLRLAEHVGNITSMCEYAKRLTKVDVNSIKYRFIENASNTFRGCTNLISATGFKRNFTMSNCSGMFSGDYNLITSDAQLPFGALRSGACSTMYYNCSKLAVDVDKLIPETWSGVGPFSMNSTFNNCDGLLSVSGDKLWNNPKITFTNTANTFIGCSAAIRELVPASWGGTGSEDLITKDKFIIPDDVKEALFQEFQQRLLGMEFGE